MPNAECPMTTEGEVMQTEAKNKMMEKPAVGKATAPPVEDVPPPVLTAKEREEAQEQADYIRSKGWSQLRPDATPSPLRTWRDPLTSGFTTWYCTLAEAYDTQLARDTTPAKVLTPIDEYRELLRRVRDPKSPVLVNFRQKHSDDRQFTIVSDALNKSWAKILHRNGVTTG
jgi:hypothetical protein